MGGGIWEGGEKERGRQGGRVGVGDRPSGGAIRSRPEGTVMIQ